MKNIFEKNKFRKAPAFTLAEILIVLGIIGVVASLTISTLIQSYQEKQMVAGLQKFNSTLQQAVQLWKQDIGCNLDAYTCLLQQGLPDDKCSNFDQIEKFMKISQSAKLIKSTTEWLPAQTLNYYGDNQSNPFTGVSKSSVNSCGYLMQDGTTFAFDADPSGFGIDVDVNGRKPPNRMGKDTFPLMLGYKKAKIYIILDVLQMLVYVAVLTATQIMLIRQFFQALVLQHTFF